MSMVTSRRTLTPSFTDTPSDEMVTSGAWVCAPASPASPNTNASETASFIRPPDSLNSTHYRRPLQMEGRGGVLFLKRGLFRDRWAGRNVRARTRLNLGEESATAASRE